MPNSFLVGFFILLFSMTTLPQLGVYFLRPFKLSKYFYAHLNSLKVRPIEIYFPAFDLHGLPPLYDTLFYLAF